MATKFCPKCQSDVDVELFIKNKAHKDGLGTYCKRCWSVYLKGHYRKNSAAYKSKARRHERRMDPVILPLLAAFRSSGCGLCSETAVCCLTAHHLDPSRKEYNIADLIRRGYAEQTVREELAKCVCLCRNCHAKVHAGLVPCPSPTPLQL